MYVQASFRSGGYAPVMRVLCLILVTTLVLTGVSVASAPERARAQAIEVVKVVASIANAVSSIIRTGFSIASYFTGGPPTQQLTAALQQISADLSQILIDLDDISAELNAITKAINQIAGQDVQELAWDYIPDLQDMFGTQAASQGTLYGYSQDAYGTVSADEIDTLMNKVMGISSPGATPTDTIYKAMMAFYDVLTTGPLPGVNSALYYATNVAIMDYTGASGSEDFSTTVRSTNGVPVVAERPMYFNYEGAWPGGHCNAGVSDPGTTFYFAEGTTRPDFDSFICLQDPGGADASVRITWMRGDGTTLEQDLVVPAQARLTVNAGDVLGHADSAASDFSAKVESTNGVPIVAERPMYFNYKGAWAGGHCNSGIPAPGASFSFAEGTTRPYFDTYLCLQNPGLEAARIEVTYMKGDGTTQEQELTVPAHTRATVKVNDLFGGTDDVSSDFSATVESTNGVPIVAERPMYFNYRQAWLGGHCESGRLEPAKKIYFAEGTTRPDFDTYISLQNAGQQEALVQATYFRGDGTTGSQSIAVPPRSRATLSPRDVLGSADGPASDFSTAVESTNGVPILAERPMYFNYKGMLSGGHSESGLLQPDDLFYFAEGTTRDGFEPYFCIQNPNQADAAVEITRMGADGKTRVQDLVVPAHSRSTVSVADQPSALMEAYVDDIETIFVGNILYQLQAIRLLYEAVTRNPGYHGYASADDFASAVFGQGGIIQAEIDEFLTSVETLVMCQADTTNMLGKPTITVTPDAQAVLARADAVARALAGTGSGLSGRVIASQDVIGQGGSYNLTAYNSATGQAYPPSSTVTADVPAVSAVSGIDRTPFYYDDWSGQTVGASDTWTAVRYSYDGLPAGNYYLLDDNSNRIVPSVDVEQETYVDPQDPSKSVTVDFGDFFVPIKNGGTNAVCNTSVWQPFITLNNTANASVSLSDMSVQANLDTGYPKGQYSQKADCSLQRTQNLTVASDPSGFTPYLNYEVDFSQTTVEFINGVLYADGEARATWAILATDTNTGLQNYVTGCWVDMVDLGLTETQHVSGSKGQMPLIKGHTYEIEFTADFYVYTYTGKSLTGEDNGTRCLLNVAGGITQLQVEYQAGTPPQIWTIAPTSGSSDGKTQVTLTGQGFGSSQGDSSVTFAGTAADVVSWSDSKVVVKVPKKIASGNRPVIVHAASGDSNVALFHIN
ncbi:MAG: IPT/TIG domain-containing protein [Actinobacteria bacterium]|nr:IPT/TIG domain-containing protein [Actinomycetota bacterium]MBU1943985.1 IPT/TIG domain-containing protein [Actinomycetota bacterium]MBU2688481.1 IPT/TIG domain-containing protein [Actinomycetota bacterium]